jgi:ApeA N-terminal domain 1
LEPLKHKGLFFLPEKKDIKIPGILTFSHQYGIILELIGTFTSVPTFHLIILGLTSEGKSVSLYRNDAINYSMGSGFTVATFKCRFLFVGINFDYKRDISFRILSCKFNVLNEWLFTENLITYKHNKEQDETIIKFKLPIKKTITVDNSLKLELGKSYTQKGERNPLKITILETSVFHITYKKRMSLDLLLKTLKQFQNLLTFASQRGVFPENINIDFRIKNNAKVHSTNIYFPITNFEESSNSAIFNYEFLFSYSLIPQMVDSIIHKWFELGDNFSLIMIEFCSQFYNPKMYQEDKFLSMTACLESFHREFRNKKVISNLTRYKSLFEEGRTAFNWLLKIPSKLKFCEELRDYRNDLTHNNPEKVLRTKNIHKLYRFTEYAKIIVTTSILKELGLTNLEVKLLFQKNMIFRKL